VRADRRRRLPVSRQTGCALHAFGKRLFGHMGATSVPTAGLIRTVSVTAGLIRNGWTYPKRPVHPQRPVVSVSLRESLRRAQPGRKTCRLHVFGRSQRRCGQSRCRRCRLYCCITIRAHHCVGLNPGGTPRKHGAMSLCSQRTTQRHAARTRRRQRHNSATSGRDSL
jgi:hypothetical protein